MRALIVVALLVGCGDENPTGPDAGVEPDAAPTCETATVHLGAEVSCNEGRGVCVDQGGIVCRSKCSETSPRCAEPLWWYTIGVSDGATTRNVCFCGPAGF